MNNISKFLSVFLLVALLLVNLTACNNSTPASDADSLTETATEPKTPTEAVDYAGQIKLDMTSDTKKLEVTVKTFVDGDTTHFHVPSDMIETGVLKARYLAVNTPESTGKVEEWGKAASNFTRNKLENAASIIVESDDDKWNIDSTGSRYLVWVWYKPTKDAEYRNLNIEILQNGYAIASSTANNRYGDIGMKALNQAKSLQLHVFSKEKDPDFFYGEAMELTLKELRLHVKDYVGKKVAFEGVITQNSNNSVYLEEFDPETGVYYGMTVYYGFNLNGDALDILSVGNRSRIVGTVQYYEPGDAYQISGLKYRAMKPNDPDNIQKISEGHKAAYVPTDAETFANGKVSVTVDEEDKTFDYAYLSLYSTVEMKNLVVKSIYKTANEESSSYGALTLQCEADGIPVSVRTVVLYDKDGNLITESTFDGKTLDVKGIVDHYDGTYQIKIFSMNDIIIKN